jgi:hypothetical protein
MGLEPGGEEELSNQLIEIGDLSFDPHPQIRRCGFTQELNRHADPGQGRTKLMGSPGEKRALGFDETLDTLRRSIEARCQAGDFIPPFDFDP